MGCGGLPDDAAARVNGTIITKGEVDARIDYRNNMFPGMVSREDTENFPKIVRQTTKDLVWAELERQEAERRQISVTDSDLGDALLLMAEDAFYGDVTRMLEEYAKMGVTKEEVTNLTRERVLHEKLLAAVRDEIEVSEYDIQNYYENNLKQYEQTERRQTRHIVTSSEADAQSAISRIESGVSFVEVAKQVSIDPMAHETGGNLGLVAAGQLSPELDDSIFTMSVGEISEPINVAGKWYVVTVEAILPGLQEMLEEERHAEIEDIIAAELAATQWKSLMDGLYEKASLEYDPDYEPMTT